MDKEKFEDFKNEIAKLCEQYGMGIVCTFQKEGDVNDSMTLIHKLTAKEAFIGAFYAYKNVLQRDMKGWEDEEA